MRRCPSLVAIAASLALAACGGSSHSATSAATSTPAASAATSTQAASATASTAQSAPTTSAASAGATTTTSSASPPPEVPTTKTRSERHHGASHAASQGAHVETNMTVAASGALSPPAVSVPSGVGVEIRLTNRGSVARTVVLGVPGRPSVDLPPGAGGRLETGGQRDGTYRILVDGTPRGQLMIGAVGGP